MRYPVTLTPDDNGSIVVTFPDVPEAITYGDTVEEALSRAPDALMTIVDAFIKDRRDIPEPSATDGPAIELPSLETAKIGLYRSMRAAHVGKAELARRLNWHLPQVDRVLDVHHGSQLDQIDAAFGALGKRLVVSIEDARPRTVREEHTTPRSTAHGRAPRSADSRGRRSTSRRDGTHSETLSHRPAKGDVATAPRLLQHARTRNPRMPGDGLSQKGRHRTR